MSTSAIVMMIIGCGTVWGGTVVSIVIALTVEKKKNLNKEVKW
ncbi:methionine/alanine import family NSS transporter small subunit [Clostridium estertheticum]|uniref:Methionine/alanine import family NSS transporter small subunit n=1 Tax=Clostridium estertheticum TaxID=238834 RepID=A0AA47I7A2_9CLOT|nr:methionine/alanine import family NSS transporter small subunit [Clostridium estertheticum]MBU3156012.1 methionine/alanine import family NSS transporter small subunit [Clostridium estertheticum]MBU3201528.1 methionine/alanine import family NSS transporter small subunit [Clostridium estertheticum]WAG60655.1 methionine/alanine import family NSS transporter small subunit [Clostridium estertheticum]WAG65254.1 methionine/alanine import family NSS transporter small subunit [Clostridium estertheticu